MDNHCANNELNKNNKYNSKEDIKKKKEREDKVKKDNAYAQVMTDNNKPADIDNLDG